MNSKPIIFIGSSMESVDVANAVQFNLSKKYVPRIWNQAVFQLSEIALESLIRQLNECDFGVFVFAPDDISKIRDQQYASVRDNVIFELGLFIGKLGRERSFFIKPNNVNDFRLPSDLAGITYASYTPPRDTGSLPELVQALGTACFQIEMAIANASSSHTSVDREDNTLTDYGYTDEDYIALLSTWLGRLRPELVTQSITYSEVDKELKISSGSTKKFIVEAARKKNLEVDLQGGATITFKRANYKKSN